VSGGCRLRFCLSRHRASLSSSVITAATTGADTATVGGRLIADEEGVEEDSAGRALRALISGSSPPESAEPVLRMVPVEEDVDRGAGGCRAVFLCFGSGCVSRAESSRDRLREEEDLTPAPTSDAALLFFEGGSEEDVDLPSVDCSTRVSKRQHRQDGLV
jgi:hypothetical protein